MRWTALLAALALVACGDSENPGGHADGGSGGSGGSGGETGGTGGGEPADVQAPALEIAEPIDGTTFEDPDVTVRGVATDDRGIAALWWVDGSGARWDLPADGGREVSFAFDAILDEGPNEWTVFAEDPAGNRSELPLALRYDNTPGRRPEIVLFEADRPWAEQGDSVTLRWRVTGTRPLQLQLYGTALARQDVSAVESQSVRLVSPEVETFVLEARNETGYDAARVDVGVGANLRIWPQQARIVPGARQQLVAVNVSEVEWSVSGGELGTLSYPNRNYFRAETEGVYTVTATTHEPEPRTATATITVAAGTSPVRGFRGVGGQFAGAGWSPGAAVDASGRLWVVLPNRSGLASWRPEDGYWVVLGDDDYLQGVEKLAGGELVVIGRETLRRLAPGAATWSVEPLPELGNDGMQEVGPDGTLYRTVGRYDEAVRLFALAPGAAAFEELPVPLLAEVSALAFDDAGGLYLAGKDDAGITSVHHRPATGNWVDTGPVPFPSEPIRDLLVGADGVPRLAGRTLAVLGSTGWTTVGSFPACAEDQLCGLFGLANRSDGTLLVVERSQLYAQTAGGGFEPVGTPHPGMSTSTGTRGALRQVAEAPDGTLYLQGDLGVFALPSGAGAWVPLTEAGMLPGAETHDVIVEPDGTWTLASGGRGGLEGIHSFYRRPAGGEWAGFGNEAPDSYDADPIFAIDRDGAGNLWAFGGYPHAVFGIEAETGAVLQLPFDLNIGQAALSNPYAFGVTVEGTIYLGGYIANDWRVYRLRPGEERWTIDGSLDCASDFERDANGSLWATCSNAVYRLSGGRWEIAWDGLPTTDGSGECEDLALADDGALLLAVANGGVFRRAPGAPSWQRLGFGEPSMGASRVASRGGRTWAIARDGLYELEAATETWLPMAGVLPVQLSEGSVFEADEDGNLLIAEQERLGLLQSFDGP
jgi:hypothetical protein